MAVAAAKTAERSAQVSQVITPVLQAGDSSLGSLRKQQTVAARDLLSQAVFHGVAGHHGSRAQLQALHNRGPMEFRGTNRDI